MICLHCHTAIHEEVDIVTLFKRRHPLCLKCRRILSKWREGRRCGFCHRLMRNDEENCMDCRFLSERYRRPGKIMCPLDYNIDVKMLFHRYKFTGDCALAEVLAMFLESEFREYDMTVPVPISLHRMKERGFNQTAMVLQAAGVKYEDVLVTDKKARQSELGKMARLRAASPFSFREDFDTSLLKGKRILLVDDIYTTGITIHQAGERLYSAKPHSIDVLTFSKA